MKIGFRNRLLACLNMKNILKGFYGGQSQIVGRRLQQAWFFIRASDNNFVKAPCKRSHAAKRASDAATLRLVLSLGSFSVTAVGGIRFQY